MRLADCHNIDDFRRLAKARLPFPVFDYIDGAADDELTKARNTASYDEVDLVPGVIAATVEASGTGAHDLLARWCHGLDEVDDLPVDEVWPSLALVAWLVDRAGYPAEVVV